jgi:hypothetical protein
MYDRLMIIAMALAVASCGSGDSGGGGAPLTGITPAPTPTPTPTPSPSPTPAPASPFGLTQNADMGVLGLLQAPGVSGPSWRWFSPSEVQMSWQASPRTFAMTIPPYGAGTLVDDPNEAATSGRILVDAQGNPQARVNVFIPNIVLGTSDYVLSGQWRRLSGDSFPDGMSGLFLFFTADSVRMPPASGTASYPLGPAPDIKSRLTFDFAAGIVTGEVPLTWGDAWGPYPEVRYAVRDGRYDRATGVFSGAFDIPGSGFSGEFRGQVVGASGQAIAIVIRGATYDPYEEKWVAEQTLSSHLRE